MFAFAIWNKEKKIMFLARDMFGIKPLFYGKKGKEVYGYLKKRDVNVKAVDNNLCVENREIISLKDLSYIMADAAESVVLIASDNPVLYEDLRIEVKELIPEGKIIDLYP